MNILEPVDTVKSKASLQSEMKKSMNRLGQTYVLDLVG